MAGFDLELALDAAAVSQAVEAAQDFLASQGVDARAAHRTALAVDELLTNAATHGGGAGRPARIRLEVLDDRVQVEVEDSAAPFDPRGARSAPTDGGLADRPIGGLGVLLVTKLSRDLDYAREKDRNRTTFHIAREA